VGPCEAIDLFPQGDPETIVYLPEGESIVGLSIRGLEGSLMLGIKEDECGRPVSCAVTNELYIDTSVPAQSNPRRRIEGESE
jgi:hypothetical protein